MRDKSVDVVSYSSSRRDGRPVKGSEAHIVERELL